VQLQFAEIDRRPREPRQLAGEYGSSELGEGIFDAGELSEEWLIDAGPDATRSGMALDDVTDTDGAASDVAFKPKCLGIETSIKRHPADAECRSQVQAEHVIAARSKGFD